MAQKDPVCNMMVDEKKAQNVSEVNGQKIYLCSAQCKSQFDHGRTSACVPDEFASFF